MRFCADVRWSPEATLEGEITIEASPPVPFHGVIQLIGLLEAQLGPPPGDGDPAEAEDPPARRQP